MQLSLLLSPGQQLLPGESPVRTVELEHYSSAHPERTIDGGLAVFGDRVAQGVPKECLLERCVKVVTEFRSITSVVTRLCQNAAIRHRQLQRLRVIGLHVRSG